jgi:hypothetical protein
VQRTGVGERNGASMRLPHLHLQVATKRWDRTFTEQREKLDAAAGRMTLACRGHAAYGVGGGGGGDGDYDEEGWDGDGGGRQEQAVSCRCACRPCSEESASSRSQ